MKVYEVYADIWDKSSLPSPFSLPSPSPLAPTPPPSLSPFLSSLSPFPSSLSPLTFLLSLRSVPPPFLPLFPSPGQTTIATMGYAGGPGRSAPGDIRESGGGAPQKQKK